LGFQLKEGGAIPTQTLQKKLMKNKSSNLVRKLPNPTGKGGFQERPEDINRNGTWNPKMTFSHQYKRFLNMPVEEFRLWQKTTKDTEKTMVEELAYIAVFKARTEFKERQEVTNRTEGMPKQEISGDPDAPLIIERIVFKSKDDDAESKDSV